jgi:DNA-binding beta-propeller fold protein YncE
MMIKYFAIILIILCIASCVKTPINPAITEEIEVNYGDCLVLCEGLMGYDNSEITYINTSSGSTITQAYSQSNIGFRLGDTANDIIIENDTIYISSTIGNYIEVINLKNLKTIKRINLPENSGPRKMAIDSDYIYCTLLFESKVALIERSTLEFKGEMIDVGPQPEGICLGSSGIVYVANSAYGDFNANHEYARTISTIDIKSKTEINKIEIGPNVCEVVYNPKNQMLYAAYYNLPSLTDSLGGIVEINTSDNSIGRHWRCNPFRMALSINGDSLFFIDQKRSDKTKSNAAVSFVALQSGNYGNLIAIGNNDILYALSVSPIDGTIWVGNAKNHQSNGTLSQIKAQSLTRNIPVSLNPNCIAFVR